MMTVITEIRVGDDIAEEWDATMSERLRVAESADGWIAGHLLASTNPEQRRVIVGVWESREHWAAWHDEPSFRETRERLEELGARSGETRWFETIYEGRR